MARIDNCVIRQREELGADRCHKLFMTGERKVRSAVMMDKIHYQNIMTNAFIITKTNPNLIGNQIISDLNRSYTTWTGESGYKKEPIQVIMTIISKYESQQLKQIVASEDPDAFITYTDHLEIIGNFEKRFDA